MAQETWIEHVVALHSDPFWETWPRGPHPGSRPPVRKDGKELQPDVVVRSITDRAVLAYAVVENDEFDGRRWHDLSAATPHFYIYIPKPLGQKAKELASQLEVADIREYSADEMGPKFLSVLSSAEFRLPGKSLPNPI